MNKILLRNFLYVICMAVFLTACDDNDDEGGSEMNGIYSNKLSAPEGGKTLDLTYSGREFIGKDVTFKLVNDNTANITLQGILPGETATLLENVSLSAAGNGYSFSGNGTGSNGTTFTYKGNVDTEKMTLALTDVKITANQLTANSTWYPVQTGVSIENDPALGSYTCIHSAFHLVTDNALLAQFAPQLEPILGNLITWFISNVTFNPDGNITARYATMPEGKEIGDLISTPQDRKDSEWIASPINLASYYVKDDAELYVVPNIDMILYQVQLNKTKADDGGLDLAVITAVYQQLTKWSTTGIRMNIRKNSEAPYNQGGNLIAYKGDIFLSIDKDEIAAFLPLLPLVKDLLPEDMGGSLGAMIGPLLDLLANSLQQTKTLEMGMMLTKEK